MCPSVRAVKMGKSVVLKKNAAAELNRKFYDVNEPTAYTARLARSKDGRTFLDRQLAYSLHRPVRKIFPRRRTIVALPYRIFQADLADLSLLKASNRGYKFILTVIDAFSRLAFAEPLKNKTGGHVSIALKKIFSKCEKIPGFLHTDRGSEFYNEKVLGLLKSLGVELYSTDQLKTKASIVERFNKTIKTRLYMYMTANFTKNYVGKLESLVESYNNAPHRSLGGLTPRQASGGEFRGAAYHALYPKITKKAPKPKLSIGDIVRIAREQKAFEKGYWVNWTDAYYSVVCVENTVPVTYKIVDIENKPVMGTFYEQQLQRLPEIPDIHRVERVIRSAGKKLLVKWLGYSSAHNSWIAKKALYKTVKHG